MNKSDDKKVSTTGKIDRRKGGVKRSEKMKQMLRTGSTGLVTSEPMGWSDISFEARQEHMRNIYMSSIKDSRQRVKIFSRVG